MNQINISGRMVNDPELRSLQDGTSVCGMRVAVRRPKAAADGTDTDFFSIDVWGKQAENVAKYMSKGSKVLVTGSMHVRRYKDKNDVSREEYKIRAQNVEFLDSKNAVSQQSSLHYDARAVQEVAENGFEELSAAMPLPF